MGRCEPDLGGRFRKTQIIPSRRPRPAMAISIPAPTSAPGGGTSADRQACDRRPVSDDLRLVFTLAGRLGHRQLQHGRALAFDELRHEYVFAVGEFDRVMMAIGNVRIDLAELADAGVDGARPDPAIVVADVVGEGELRSRQQADRDGHVGLGGEAARRGAAEGGRDDRLADLCGTRRDGMQAVVTHRVLLIQG
ncbi:bll4828 [Bradyrhizobium diazoefficiens USDA 110]|uniref:Bll4828 protein n=1 Tax=Bradyrhizobium diazoefficiens (strain JCM 10833 / BCRC 13528 / IAM 13628 / NBRC 14792 / USDA 110) TaxID=224911 RepID=Q89KS5_BRADU|nr:hypothetical protein CO678_34990 [Bradyrhizobium diazoefficiens]QBP23610.1 hypothetical protein Bdiaspc4_25340 [Bradyrhizobium diazoefficiens]BAC50093.1 bll4828 [Bradyrhizobium diazoefficiens USDA 110]